MLKSPYPYFGGKSRVAHLVWDRFGDVPNYVEPFFGSGADPMLRIAVCGYEGEHEFPKDWECIAWKANGGYANQAGETPGKVNATRERIWFSPHCIRPTLFGFDHESQMIY